MRAAWFVAAMLACAVWPSGDTNAQDATACARMGGGFQKLQNVCDYTIKVYVAHFINGKPSFNQEYRIWGKNQADLLPTNCDWKAGCINRWEITRAEKSQ